jgi:hypothetical protein
MTIVGLRPSQHYPVFDIRPLPDVLSLFVDVADRVFCFHKAQAILKTPSAVEQRLDYHLSMQINEPAWRVESHSRLFFYHPCKSLRKIAGESEFTLAAHPAFGVNEAESLAPLNNSPTLAETVRFVETTFDHKLSSGVDEPITVA